jgi:N-acetylglucosamine-6-phosphate deacetylase
MSPVALVGATPVGPDRLLPGQAVVVEGGRILSLTRLARLPRDVARVDLDGGLLLPGFIDTQVNGGGGVLLNDAPSVEGLVAIAAAHRAFGSTGVTPTLISADLDVVRRAIEATEAALAAGVAGLIGLHIEGPFLNFAKRGVHDPTRLRGLDAEAIELLTAPTRGRRIVTLAPELAPAGAIRALSEAGVLVCAGHTLADYQTMMAALDEGLSGYTHLFNAMTQMDSRAPGVVGAALSDRRGSFGLIVDGLHVHPASLRVALAAGGAARAMLVTDAMPIVGAPAGRFRLGDLDVRVEAGACRAADGTLAGSSLDMASALRNAMTLLGIDVVTASRMASGNPARFLRLAHERGMIAPGLRADLVHLDDTMTVRQVWIGGEAQHCAGGLGAVEAV